MTTQIQAAEAQETETAIFAGGCFWCMEPPFDKIDGVISTTSGYTAGEEANPTYKEVSAGKTGHTEAIKVVFNPKKVKYETLLTTFWENIDPTQANGQFCDIGSQYRTGIYTRGEEQAKAAKKSLKVVQKKLEGANIYTEIQPAGEFYAAEDYHQDYYLKNPLRYKYYRYACGRDKQLQQIWGEKK